MLPKTWRKVKVPGVVTKIADMLRSKLVSTLLWNTPLNLYQKAKEGFLS